MPNKCSYCGVEVDAKYLVVDIESPVNVLCPACMSNAYEVSAQSLQSATETFGYFLKEMVRIKEVLEEDLKNATSLD